MWIIPEKGIESRTGIKFLYDKREGGQTGELKAAGNAYTTDIANRGIKRIQQDRFIDRFAVRARASG